MTFSVMLTTSSICCPRSRLVMTMVRMAKRVNITRKEMKMGKNTKDKKNTKKENTMKIKRWKRERGKMAKKRSMKENQQLYRRVKK